MSTKLDDGNENGWDIDDDNEWDDWGDAEDNLESDAQTTSAESKTHSSSTVSNTANNNTRTAEKTTEQDTLSTRIENNNLPKESVHQHQLQDRASGGWGSLFGGVVSSVLSTANELTSSVTQGLDKVIGVPDPAELARMNALEDSKIKSQHQESLSHSVDKNKEEDRYLPPANAATPAFGLNLVNNVTFLGSKVINTGLDTLEGIGKKTMNILQENDPLLKNKIKKLGLEQDKPNLSEILKEAKKENEQLEQSLKELSLEKTKAQLRFDVLFENNCGLVHFEALEILSKESELKIQTLKDSVTGKALEELLETTNEVKELMELEDLESEPEKEDYDQNELNDNLNKTIEDIDIQIQFDEITKLWSTCVNWLADEENNNLEVHIAFAKAITSLAETCALEMLKLHKIAELLLVKEHHSTANEVDGIVQLCTHFNMHLQTVANCFATHLSKHTQQDDAKAFINTLFAEMLQARQQLEKAFHLFLPIVQIGAI